MPATHDVDVTDDRVRDWFEANYRSLSQAQRTYLAEPVRESLTQQVLLPDDSKEAGEVRDDGCMT